MLANTCALVTSALLMGLGVLSGPGPVAIPAAARMTPSGAPTAPSSCQAVIVPAGFGTGPVPTAHASWTDNSDNETGFEVQWKSTNPKLQGTFTVAPNTTNTSVTSNLTPASHVSVRVRAFNAAGSSAWTNWAKADSP